MAVGREHPSNPGRDNRESTRCRKLSVVGKSPAVGLAHKFDRSLLRAKVPADRHECGVTVGGKGLEALAASLRGLPRPIIGRLSEGRLWLDCRCLESAEEAVFIAQLPGRGDTA